MMTREYITEQLTKGASDLFDMLDVLNNEAEQKRQSIQSLRDKEEAVLSSIATLKETEKQFGLVLEQKAFESDVLKNILKGINDAQASWEAKLIEIIARRNALSAEIENLENEHEAWSAVHRPTIEEMNARQKRLDQREKDLDTIKNRWERKFASRGARFATA